MSQRKIDVSTLSGWSELTTGNHTITLKATASGYADSDSSSGVTVNKPQPRETWMFNSVLSFNQGNVGITAPFSTAGGVSCDSMIVDSNERILIYFTDGNPRFIYSGGEWRYREWIPEVITFSSPVPTGTSFYAWLTANARKQ